MRLFGLGGGGNQDETPEAKARREASERNLAAGGLPLDAIERLQEQAGRQGTPGHIFTSDLSVNELCLVHQAGYEPLGQIMGSSMYHIGWQYMPSGYWSSWGGNSAELTTLTQAFYEARHLAIGRLQQEAQLLGATGVVGVRLEHKEYEWGASMLEFSAIGTAIRETDTPRPPANYRPWVSDLSGEDFWMLRQSGFQPVGLAVGNCTYYCVASWRTQNASYSWSNIEFTDFTQAVYNARSLAMERMQVEALTFGATGIVGADVVMKAEPREVDLGNDQHRTDLVCHFTAIGTSIAPYVGRWPTFNVLSTISLK